MGITNGYLLLFQNARAYAKLGDYLRKMQTQQIEVLQSQGDFGNPGSGKGFEIETKSRKRSNWDFANAISDLGGKFNSKFADKRSAHDFGTERSFRKGKLKK